MSGELAPHKGRIDCHKRPDIRVRHRKGRPCVVSADHRNPPIVAGDLRIEYRHDPSAKRIEEILVEADESQFRQLTPPVARRLPITSRTNELGDRSSPLTNPASIIRNK